jgi:hypothetical protein
MEPATSSWRRTATSGLRGRAEVRSRYADLLAPVSPALPPTNDRDDEVAGGPPFPYETDEPVHPWAPPRAAEHPAPVSAPREGFDAPYDPFNPSSALTDPTFDDLPALAQVARAASQAASAAQAASAGAAAAEAKVATHGAPAPPTAPAPRPPAAGPAPVPAPAPVDRMRDRQPVVNGTEPRLPINGSGHLRAPVNGAPDPRIPIHPPAEHRPPVDGRVQLSGPVEYRPPAAPRPPGPPVVDFRPPGQSAPDARPQAVPPPGDYRPPVQPRTEVPPQALAESRPPVQVPGDFRPAQPPQPQPPPQQPAPADLRPPAQPPAEPRPAPEPPADLRPPTPAGLRDPGRPPMTPQPSGAPTGRASVTPVSGAPVPAAPVSGMPVSAAPVSGIPVSAAPVFGAAPLPQRIPALPDVPEVPEDGPDDQVVGPEELGRTLVAQRELARIATQLRYEDDLDEQPPPRNDGFDFEAVLAAVRQVPGVSDANLKPNANGVHTLRLDLAEGADPAGVSRTVARLLKQKMGLAAEPRRATPSDNPVAGTAPAPRMPIPPGPAEQLAGPVADERSRQRHPVNTLRGRVATDGRAEEAEPRRGYRSGGAFRVVLDQVQVSTLGMEATVEVRMSGPSGPAIGVASGPAVDGYVLRLAAVAATSAIDQLLSRVTGDPHGRSFVEHAAVVPFGSCEVAVTVILLTHGGQVEQLTGSSLVNGDPRQAVVRATLAAVNRRLDALLG